MKITKEQLRQIIKEEVDNVSKELESNLPSLSSGIEELKEEDVREIIKKMGKGTRRRVNIGNLTLVYDLNTANGRLESIFRNTDGIDVEIKDGKISWYKNGSGRLNSINDQPALIRRSGDKLWFKNGRYHRGNDLPAIEYADGTKFWFKNGEFIR